MISEKKVKELSKSIRELERLKISMTRGNFAVVQVETEILRHDLEEFVEETIERYQKIIDQSEE